jgi:hypothetical protein
MVRAVKRLVSLITHGASLLPLFAASTAQAGNDDELFVGNQAALMGGAVSATVSDSSATWYNPAGLGAAERDQVDVSATVYTVRLYHSPVFIQSRSGASSPGGMTELVVAPAQVAFVRRLGAGVVLGVGYFVPRATNYTLRESLRAGTGAGQSDWQVAVALADTQHYGAVALGFRPAQGLRLGASLIGGVGSNNHAFMLFGSAGRDGTGRALNSASLIGTQSRLSVELGLGMQLDLGEHVRLGVSLRSPQLLLNLSNDDLVNGAKGAVDDGGSGQLSSQARHDQTNSGLDLWRAGRIGLALAYRYAHGHISAEIDLQPPLSRPTLKIERETLVNVRLGIYHSVSSAFALGFGLFTDRASQAVSWQVISMRGDFYGVTAGVEYSNEHSLAPGERASSLVFNSVFALRYAFSPGEIGTVLVDPDKLTTAPFTSEPGKLSVHELGLYVGSGLRF